jgi:hypothetical protein
MPVETQTAAPLQIKPIGRVTIYQTIKPIENPMGDGRHNRAKWRSPLDQTRIPAGFIFGVDDEGNIYDHSTPTQVLQAKRKGTAELRQMLISVAGSTMEPVEPPPPTIEDVIAEAPKDAVPELLKKLGMSPEQLREALLSATSPSSASGKAQTSVMARATPAAR